MVAHGDSLIPPRELLVSWLSRMYRHRLTTTTGGNLSFIDDDGTLYITPSGGDKAIVPPSHVAVRSPGSDSFEGIPSMEWKLHTLAYKSREKCRAVLHAHSMTLIAFSLARDSSDGTGKCHDGVPDTRCLHSAWLACGKVEFVPYYPPGSEELAVACSKALEFADCIILQNHGVVTIGECLQEAYDRFITLEKLAQSIINAIPIGRPISLKENVLTARQKSQMSLLRPVAKCPCHLFCCFERSISGIEKEKRSELCNLVKRAYDQGLFTASSGAISVRLPNYETNSASLGFLITPTHVDRSLLSAEDICYLSKTTNCTIKNFMTCNGNNSKSVETCYFHKGQQRNTYPSHTTEVHDMIYSSHPDINCIIVAQPSYTISFCITGKYVNTTGIPESHLIVGDVVTLPFESLENRGALIAETLNPSAGISTVFITGFGVISVGTSPLKTFIQVEVCESICGVLLTAMRRGPPVLLNKTQVHEIDTLFQEH